MSQLMTILLSATTVSGFYGTYAPGYFWSCFGFAILGVFISLTIEANGRNVHSNKTPTQFSYATLLAESPARILRQLNNLAVIYVAIRFCPELLGKELNDWAAFGIGLGYDRIIAFIKTLRRKKQ